MIRIGDLELEGFVYIPPMAGYTDLVYRQLCRDYDPDVLMSTEMLSSKAMMFEKKSRRMDIPENDAFTGVQIFGHEPEVMAKAARMAEDAGAKFIDINMGCPVPKITNGKDGAALMKEPELAAEIVRAVIKAVSLPVTVKTRLGWCHQSLNAIDLAKRFQDLGVRALTIHGRTRSQKYEGKANWNLIAEVVRKVNIPVFANGDVRTVDDAKEIIKITGASGVAVARATMGRPWFSRQVNHYLKTGELLADPTVKERLDLALKHCKMLIDYKGLAVGTKECRKHIIHYTSGLAGAAKLRARLGSIHSYEQIEDIIQETLLSSELL
jgi:tRNA-dihydrouridine synthase B